MRLRAIGVGRGAIFLGGAALFGACTVSFPEGDWKVTNGTSGGGAGGSITTSTSSRSSSSGSGGMACNCVAAAPSGWSGPFSLYDGPAAGAPECGGGFPTQMYKGHNKLTADPAMCSCSCDPAVGQTCTESTNPINLGDTPCGVPVTCAGQYVEPSNWNGSCDAKYNWLGGNNGCGAGCAGTPPSPCHQQITANALQIVGGGACTPNIKPPSLPSTVWGEFAEACAPATPATGCPSANESCQPVPAAPFHAGLCIMQKGQVTCPEGVFSEHHVFYEGVMDTRSCTTCTCGPASGATCSGTVQVYVGAACSGAPVATLHPTSSKSECVNLAGNPAAAALAVAFDLVPGSCPASGGQPKGAATPTSPTTFCCIP